MTRKLNVALTVCSLLVFLVMLNYILLFQDKFQLAPKEAIKSVNYENGVLFIELTELVEYVELYEDYYNENIDQFCDEVQSYTIIAMGSRRSYQYRLKKESETISIPNYNEEKPVFFHQIIPSQESFYKPQVIIFGQATLSECSFVIYPRIAIKYYGIMAIVGSIVFLLLAYLFRKREILLKLFAFMVVFLFAYFLVFLITGFITYQMKTLLLLQLFAALFLSLASIGFFSLTKGKIKRFIH